jgi:hypothetical protein
VNGTNWLRLLIGLCLAGLIVGGCDSDRVGFWVTNDTELTVNIYYAYDGKEQLYASRLGPGQKVPIQGLLENGSACRGPLIARDSSGVEVARHSDPICNHETWVIETQPTPSPT